MSFSLRLFLCFVVFYSAAEGYTGLMKPDEKPSKFADQPGCYVSSLDLLLKPNEPVSVTDGSCQKYTCQSEDTIFIEGCSAIGVEEGCELVDGDKSLPYPKCCDVIKCKDSTGNYVIHNPYGA